MGQVWTKADIDGDFYGGHEGGAGSVMAVTCLGRGRDDEWGTRDDRIINMNVHPNGASADVYPEENCTDRWDQIRGFISMHVGGAQFAFADGAVKFLDEEIDDQTWRRLSTIREP